MLDNRNLHLDLHLHQLFIPLGTCVVAKNLSNNNNTTNHSTTTTTTTTTKLSFDDHWSLRMEAAQCLVKACNIYGDQYTTIRPRLIKLFTQQALRKDRPLPTQYGGIVGISLFGPRAIDAFILPLAREYWECWEEELRTLSAISSTTTSSTDIPDSHGDDNAATTPEVIQQRTKKRRILAEGREYELHMCQRALLSAVQIFMQNVTNAEKSKRVDIRLLMDVFGERLIPMQPDITDYMAAVV
jgi:transcription initiation factor TFIID subunit 6